MTKQEILDQLKQGIEARRYSGMSQEMFLTESVDVMCGVIAEALAKRPLLTLPRGKK